MKTAAKFFTIIALTTATTGALVQNAQHGSESTKELTMAAS